MNTEDHRLMSILYDPASYAHVSHVPELFLTHPVRNRTLLNYWLLKQRKLCDLPENWQPGEGTLSHLLAHWHLIPTAAHLLGGYILRERLPEMKGLLLSDSLLLAFISLPLRYQLSPLVLPLSAETNPSGLAFILGLFPLLPEALNQRLELLFPSGFLFSSLSVPQTPDNYNLLKMALSYAHHYQQ